MGNQTGQEPQWLLGAMVTREDLEAALNVPITRESFFSGEMVRASELVEAAARRQLALMPEKCGTCDGEGHYVVQSTRGQWQTDDLTCPTCRGAGKAYPPETVEKIADVITQGILLGDSYKGHAIRVLDALNGETP